MNPKTQIIILGAGKGTRMGPDLPKVLVELNNKPLIQHVIDNTASKLVLDTNPIVVIGHKKELVLDILPNNINTVVQNQQLGTGHAVKITEEAVPEDVQDVLILYGDMPFISANTIRALSRKHRTHPGPLTMLTSDPGDFSDWKSCLYNGLGDLT